MVGQAIDLIVAHGAIITAFARGHTLGLGCKASATAMAIEEMTVSSAVTHASTSGVACLASAAGAA